MRIDHINICAPAGLVARVRDFYCAVFGLVEGFRPQFQSPGYWLYAGDRALVHLSVNDRHGAGDGPGHLDHVAFQTSGLEQLLERLRALEIEYRSNYIPEFEMTQVFFTDPAGTGLEVNFPGERKAGDS
jgi:catechol 2,3-dioxygenase-like lactoylglutathione lyase family enzyme